MRIEMLASIMGGADPANGLDQEFCYREGQIVEVRDDLALKWMSSDPPRAKVVKEERETATVGASETAAKGTRKRQVLGR